MENSQTGLTGEFYTLAQLVQRGYVATLTLGNTKGVDILVANSLLSQLFKVEVKTTDQRTRTEALFADEPCHSWAMSQKHETIQDPNLFYCFVALNGVKELPKFFIVPSIYVSIYVREQHAYWVRTRKTPPADTKMRRFRIRASDPLGFSENWDVFSGQTIQENHKTLTESWGKQEPK